MFNSTESGIQLGYKNIEGKLQFINLPKKVNVEFRDAEFYDQILVIKGHEERSENGVSLVVLKLGVKRPFTSQVQAEVQVNQMLRHHIQGEENDSAKGRQQEELRYISTGWYCSYGEC